AALLDAALGSGEAARRAEALVEAQGGDPRVVADPSILPRAAVETPVPSPRSGFVTGWDARALGELLVDLGGGRRRTEDSVDPGVGIRLLRKSGDPVSAGEPVAIVATRAGDGGARERVAGAVAIGDAAPPKRPIVMEEVTP
ncbi:MAG TPA: thymidine phosphorylase, partial [Candidatus Eisenbacteria bacterium]